MKEYARLLGYPPGKPLEGDVLARAEEAMARYRRHGRPRTAIRILGTQAVAAITAGPEVEEEVAKLWKEDRVDEAYFLDRYAATVVEEIALGIGLRSGSNEDLRELLGRLEPLAPPIEILPSGMLKPKNSLLAVFDLSATGSPCSRCDLPRCAFRRKAA